MKKILASCLTCCALLGSMCFSSPLAQLHATLPSGEAGSTTKKFDHDIDLKVEEKEFPIRCTINNAPKYSHLIIKGLDSTYEYVVPGEDSNGSGPSSKDDIPYADGQFKTQIGESAWNFYIRTTNTENPVEAYNIVVNQPTARIGDQDLDNNPIITVDFSTGEFKVEIPENLELSDNEQAAVDSISGEFYKSDIIIANKTTAEVKPGDTFSLNLPSYFVSGDKFMFPELMLTESAGSLTSIDWDAPDSDTSLTGTITDEAKPGETVSFKIKAKLEHRGIGIIDYNPTLVNYNSDPGDGDGEILGDNQYFLPIEFKIVDDGQGDIVDDGEEDEINLFLNLTPEYKKLTEKGETYKLDASVEIDEDADAEAKESFEAMKKDGQFKVSFVSRDTGVATVAEDGTVTAVANGSTEILAYVEGSEDELFATSKVDVEIPVEVEEVDSTYPKTGDNFMAISAAILTLGLSALVVALMSKKKKDVNEE
ncbi:MAG: hypothetical protein Q4B93_04880 [Clostridia bacterium]|nr:hypothetical protein [Clostridia bacterium]